MKAIISVFDKTGIVDFARELSNLGVEIISSGGTYNLLKENDIKVKKVSDITGFAECLDGRVKTLHPKIHGGILADRTKQSHLDTLKQLDISPIDIVVVNLYPFKQVISKDEHSFEDAIENIDIGGPTMIRSSAKNHQSVLVVTDTNDYNRVIQALKDNNINDELRLELAQKAFKTTASYDIMIANYLEKKIGAKENPDTILLELNKKQDLRYGENSHQKASYYNTDSIDNKGVETAKFLNGKELSYNNYNDAQGAINLALEFEEPVCVAVKHATPCGVAIADNVYDSYIRAYETDPVSIFGGIVCFNKNVDKKTALEMNKIFLEVIIAPSYDEDAKEVLKQKKNLRVLELPLLNDKTTKKYKEFKSLGGGFLVQDNDYNLFDEDILEIPTKTKPTKEQKKDLEFAMKVVKHVKSNAIVIAKQGRTIGIGGGDVSRIFATNTAISRAGENCKDSVLASDAFFPFEDVVNIANKNGIKAIIQPGGSLNDQKSIDECDKFDMAMVFTGIRHFKH